VHFAPVVSTSSTTEGGSILVGSSTTEGGSIAVGGSTFARIRPGDLATVEITYAAPHHLVADGEVIDVRRTRSGDAWEARNTTAAETTGISLGMPTVGRPAS
jgi:hypothetical protein